VVHCALQVQTSTHQHLQPGLLLCMSLYIKAAWPNPNAQPLKLSISASCNLTDTNPYVCSCTAHMCRLCVVALELHEDTSQLESADITRGSLTSGKPSLFAFLIPRLTSYHPRLVNLAWPISYWLRGCLQLASRVRLGPASQSRTGEQEFAGHFAPSPHMVSSIQCCSCRC
jgi:hypothetical protein